MLREIARSKAARQILARGRVPVPLVIEHFDVIEQPNLGFTVTSACSPSSLLTVESRSYGRRGSRWPSGCADCSGPREPDHARSPYWIHDHCAQRHFGVSGLAAAEPARAVKVTVLSTMLAGDPGRGIGEWGFAALLEVDGRRLLLDTGERPETVLRNAGELGIDLSDVTDLVITHNHGDHTAGLVTLRRELAKKNARALSRAHVARGIFDRRPGPTVRRATACCL